MERRLKPEAEQTGKTRAEELDLLVPIREAERRDISPNRLVVELAMEGLERREWPRTEAEIHLLRSAMFTAQAIIRDMERTGREEEIEQISRNISEVAPELPHKQR